MPPILFTLQVEAARVAADAAQATHAGKIDNAAQAVLEAAKSIDVAMNKNKHENKVTQSKTCVII